MLQHGCLPGGGVYVGVYLGGEDGFVAQHLLDDPQVRTPFDEVGGEGVAEGVRGNLLVDAGGHRLFLHEVEDGDAAERPAGPVQEKDVLERAGGRFRTDRKIVPDGFRGHFPEGNDALLVALADDIDIPLVQMDMGNPEAGAFAHAETASVQDLQDGAAAESGRRLRVHGGEDGIDFLHRQDGGKVLAQLRGVDAVTGILLHFALFHAPVEERPERAEHPGLGTFGKAFFDPFREIPFDLGRADVRGPVPFIGAEKSFHIPRIGRHRIRRHAPFDPQVVAVVLGDPVHQRAPYFLPYSSIWPR